MTIEEAIKIIAKREEIYLEAYEDTHNLEYLHKARALTEIKNIIREVFE